MIHIYNIIIIFDLATIHMALLLCYCSLIYCPKIAFVALFHK